MAYALEPEHGEILLHNYIMLQEQSSFKKKDIQVIQV